MSHGNETDLITLVIYEEQTEAFTASNVSEGREYTANTLEWIIPVSIAYVIIFFAGLLGNISTCIVITRNKSMHSPSNYYLFSLAISDLLIAFSGLIPELLGMWLPQTYIFGKSFCVIQVFTCEATINATILTVTAFSIERYIAICYPLLAHVTAKLSRIIKCICAIWLAAFCLALPQAIQLAKFVYGTDDDLNTNVCSIATEGDHPTEISALLFFVCPMILITILYILMGIKLSRPQFSSTEKASSESVLMAQKRVIKMLVAVVVAFFICWAPYHAERLLVRYLVEAPTEVQKALFDTYVAVLHISTTLFYVSTAINPVLYNIMSKKFRDAFKTTYNQLCCKMPNSEASKLPVIQQRKA